MQTDRRTFIGQLALLGAGLSLPSLTLARAQAESPVGVILDQRFLEHVLAPGHPESPERMQAILAAWPGSGLRPRLTPIKPLESVQGAILREHTPAHIAAIRARYGSDVDQRVALAVGAAVAATDQVCSGHLQAAFACTRPPGHHALNTGREEGFCFYNNIAIAARHARARYGCQRVLIVDWDYHHGNATEASFYTDADCLFFSTHDWRAYPRTGDPRRIGSAAGTGYNINVHLPCGSGDAELIAAFKQRLLPAAERFKPELVLVSAGFDSRQDDRLGCFEVTDQGFAELTHICCDIARRHAGGRLVSVLEGGYNPQGNASAVIAHVKALLEDAA